MFEGEKYMVESMLIFGILLSTVSIILIIKYKDNESDKYNEINKIYNEIIEYSDVINDIVMELEVLLQNKKSCNDDLEVINSYNRNNDFKEKEEILEPKTMKIQDKVIELYKSGNSIDKIAELLNKGKREVDMIVKLNIFNKK